MRWRKWASVALIGILAGCASPRADGPKLGYRRTSQGAGPSCAGRFGRPDLSRQKAEVDSALRDLTRRHDGELEKLEQDASLSNANDADARLDELANAYRRARVDVLGPLAARGNADAMARLSDSGLRDSDAPADVDQWFKLISCAADLGHPFSLDELVRWYWHQRGDGSIAQVQANRATALAFANRAALSGNLFAISRIATYVAGDVHQYPANLSLARRLMRLCAQTGDRSCEEALAGEWVYDPGLSAMDAYAWLSRAADGEPERFAKQRDISWDKLTAEERLSATRAARTWRPTPWRDLQTDWNAIKADILANGETSTGALLSCGTQRPWCYTLSSGMSGDRKPDR
jgi:hypothetical protein